MRCMNVAKRNEKCGRVIDVEARLECFSENGETAFRWRFTREIVAIAARLRRIPVNVKRVRGMQTITSIMILCLYMCHGAFNSGEWWLQQFFYISWYWVWLVSWKKNSLPSFCVGLHVYTQSLMRGVIVHSHGRRIWFCRGWTVCLGRCFAWIIDIWCDVCLPMVIS